MKYFINKSTNNGNKELIGPFLTKEEAIEKMYVELNVCSILADMNRVQYSAKGNTIQYENGEAIHFSLFSEIGQIEEEITVS